MHSVERLSQSSGVDRPLVESPAVTLERWEDNGLDDSIGLVGTSVWRLESIIRLGLLSNHITERNEWMPEVYRGRNLIVFSPLPGLEGHTATIDKFESFAQAECYAGINSEQDWLEPILARKGLSEGEAVEFMDDELEPAIFTFYTMSKRSLRRIARRVSKRLPFRNQEIYQFNRTVRKLTGVVLGLDPIIAQTHAILPGLDDPRDEAIIDLGARPDLPSRFISGIYIPSDISEYERAELDRIRSLSVGYN